VYECSKAIRVTDLGILKRKSMDEMREDLVIMYREHHLSMIIKSFLYSVFDHQLRLSAEKMFLNLVISKRPSDKIIS
jgi:hypothetical protein